MSSIEGKEAVGIRKASLYSLFANKQGILDKVVEMVLEGYYKNPIFVNANWNDPYIKRGLMLLMIEQFRNEELARLQTKMNYEDVLQYFEGMMKFLIRKNILKDVDPENPFPSDGTTNSDQA